MQILGLQSDRPLVSQLKFLSLSISCANMQVYDNDKKTMEEQKPIVQECPRIKLMLERVETLESGGISDEALLKKEALALSKIRRLGQETKDDLWARMWDGKDSCGREVSAAGVCGTCYNTFHSKSMAAANRRYEASKRKPNPGSTSSLRKAKNEYARRSAIKQSIQAWLEINPNATEADIVIEKNRLESIQRKEARIRTEKYSEKLTNDGQTLSILEWATKLRISPPKIIQRLSILGLGMDDVLNPAPLAPWKTLGVRMSSSQSSARGGLIQKLRFVLDAQVEEDPEEVLARIDELVESNKGREILKMRFVVTDKNGNRGCIQSVPAEKFGLTRERIRQIENDALRQLFAEEISKGFFELIKPK